MKTNQSEFYFLVVLSILMAFTSLSTDIYLPAIPKMEQELQANVELTITSFLLGFAFGQLIWGPISDKYGRKKILFIGLIIFTIGSLGCGMSTNINQIVFWRAFQAFGGCTAPMLSRAMVRDRYTGSKVAEMLSTLMITMAIAPIIGPLLGGQIIKYTSWHYIFYLLTVIGVLMLGMVLFLPETKQTKGVTTSLKTAFANYKLLLINRRFMLYSLTVTFFYVGVYAFIAGSPFVYINYFHIESENYGWLFSCNIVGVMLFSFINRKLVNRFTLDHLLIVSTGFALLASSILVVMCFQVHHIIAIVLPVFLYFSMNGIVASTANAAALNLVPQMAGSAAALLGAMQYGSGIISTLLLTWMKDDTPRPMGIIICLFALAAFVSMLLNKRDSSSITS